MSSNDLAAKREARKRRILENADSRLKKITDLPTAQTCNEVKSAEFPIFEKEFSPQKDRNNVQHIHNAPPLVQLADDKEDDYERTVFPQEWTPLTNSNATPPQIPITTFEKIVLAHQTHLIIVSIITYLMLSINLGYLIYENAMMPFFTLEIAHVMIKQKEPKNWIVSLVITFLGMYGISSKVSSAFADALTLAVCLGRDLSLHLFITILCTNVFG